MKTPEDIKKKRSKEKKDMLLMKLKLEDKYGLKL